jgi:hypothetical protein
MYDSALNFCLNDKFNANYDITWSFEYCVSGSNIAKGGFSTFLFSNDILSGGGSYDGYGYLPKSPTQGVIGGVLGITLDTNNNFNIYGTNFNLLCSFSLFSNITPLIKTSNEFNILKFNLTDFSRILKIYTKNKNSNTYKLEKTIETGLNVVDNTFYQIGIGYSTPVILGQDKIILKIKNFHVQGNQNIPTTKFSIKPYIINSSYLLLSPSSAYIDVSYTNPALSGYLLKS